MIPRRDPSDFSEGELKNCCRIVYERCFSTAMEVKW